MTKFAKHTVQRYRELESDSDPRLRVVGSGEVATTPERWNDLKRADLVTYGETSYETSTFRLDHLTRRPG